MKKLTQSFKAVVTARWFPTFTKPILLGLVGSGVVAGMHFLGINVLPGQAEAAAAPLVGFLLTTIAQKAATDSASAGTAHVTLVAHALSGEPTVGKTIATSLVSQIAEALDANPTLVQSLAVQALENVMNPRAVVNPPQGVAPESVQINQTLSSLVDAVTTAQEKAAPATPAPVAATPAPSAPAVQPVVSPASEAAPHITQ